MSLKLAAEEDREEFLRMSQLFYEASPFFPSVQFSKKKTEEVFDLALETKHSQALVLLYEETSKVHGMLIGYASNPPFSYDLVASELAWWVDPPYRGHRGSLQLVDAYEEWAHRVGCSSVAMSLLPDLTDLSKVYERRGYHKTEISYLKAL